MADEKVSALATAGAYNDADILYIIQGGVSVKTTWGSIKTALRTAIEYPEVANYAALPAAADHNGEIYVCLASQGSVWLLTLKDSGFYLSDGSVWTRLGALPADYFTDSVLSIADDADPTKVVKFSCAAVATLTTRTFTWPDADGTVMLVGDAPTAHKTSHENGGGDEINVGGLSGVLADPQPPIIGATGTTAVAGNDARLTDERVPTAAGLTTKFGTNKATIADGDKFGQLDSAASDAPKHTLWSLIKSTLKTYFDGYYGNKVRVIGFTVSGSGAATGKVKGFVCVPYGATITGWSITVDAGTATVKCWKIATGTAKPTIADVINTSGVAISSGTHVRSSTVADFTTTTVTAGDIFAFDITAISGVADMTFELELTQT